MSRMFQKIVFSLFSAFFLVSCSRKSDFNISIPNFYSSSLLLTTARTETGKIYFYTFSELQKNAFERFCIAENDAAVLIQLHGVKPENTEFSTLDFGFFYENDTDPGSLSKRPVVKSKFFEGSFALLLCINKDGNIPEGFFVKSSDCFRIENAQVVRACIGHDFSSSVPVFAFGPNGGFNGDPGRDDFSGGSQVFSSVNTAGNIMPYFKIKYSSLDGSMQKIAFGGETVSIYPSKTGDEIFSGAVKNPFSIVTYPESIVPQIFMMMAGDKSLLDFSVSSRNPLVPIKTDPGLIIGWARNMWRGNDYELFEWDMFPGVLIMDISTYAVQDDFLRRIAFFVEKAGYKGSLMSDDFLENKHGYNAHDYRAESLAAFYEKVRQENFPINAREKLLKEILLKNEVIKELSDGRITAGSGALISISQESPAYLRRTLIAHEGWHGIYFIDEQFRNTVASIYYTLDENTLAYLKKYFQVTPTLNYDTGDDYLMKNEFMAYMLQRPLSQTGKYFTNLAGQAHSQQLAKREADYVLQTGAAGFVSAAAMLDQYVNERWNLNAGRAWLIER